MVFAIDFGDLPTEQRPLSWGIYWPAMVDCHIRKLQFFMVKLPSGYVKIAIENGP